MVNQEALIERLLFYWGRIYTRQIKRSEDYKQLEKTIVILIANFKIKGLEELEYHSEWKIIETKNHLDR